jgi:hypothetical protein
VRSKQEEGVRGSREERMSGEKSPVDLYIRLPGAIVQIITFHCLIAPSGKEFVPLVMVDGS